MTGLLLLIAISLAHYGAATAVGPPYDVVRYGADPLGANDSTVPIQPVTILHCVFANARHARR